MHRPKGQKFKIVFSFIVSLKPARSTEAISKIYVSAYFFFFITYVCMCIIANHFKKGTELAHSYHLNLKSV